MFDRLNNAVAHQSCCNIPAHRSSLVGSSLPSYRPVLDQLGSRSDLSVGAPVADTGSSVVSVDFAHKDCGVLDAVLSSAVGLTTAAVVVVVAVNDA